MTGPKDRLFCYTYGQVANAESLLRHNLPQPLLDAIDWSTFKREPDVLKDPEKETRKDVVFSARYLGSRAQDPPHFFVIEHQSQPERDMALRAHRYVTRLVDWLLETHPHWRKIPEVTVLVVYPHKRRRWWAARRLEDLYAGPLRDKRRRQQWTVRFEYLVEDFAARGERQVLERSGPPLAALTLLVLAYAGSPELAQKLPEWRELIAQVLATRGHRALYRLLRFFYILGDEPAHAALRGVLHSLSESPQAEELMRSMEQVLLERGMARGKVEGLAEAVLRLLAARGVQVDATARSRILG